MLLGKA